ncbi:sybB, partial [Symbiodinium sp. KB8]
DNVKKILETHVTLESLENSSSSMSSQANKFLKQSVDLRRQIQCRNLKIKAICGTCVAALILYIVMPFIS